MANELGGDSLRGDKRADPEASSLSSEPVRIRSFELPSTKGPPGMFVVGQNRSDNASEPRGVYPRQGMKERQAAATTQPMRRYSDGDDSDSHAFRKLWLYFGLLIAAFLGHRYVRNALEGLPTRVVPAVNRSADATSTRGHRSFTKHIEDVRPGDWALADSPQATFELSWEKMDSPEDDDDSASWQFAAAGENADPDAVEFLDGDDLDGLDEDAIDASRLQLVSLRMDKSDGDELRMRFLRPVEWLEENGAKVGRSIELELSEFGVVGRAEVLSIEPCPTIVPRPSDRYHLVTGTFAHRSSRVLDLHIAGQPPLGVTGNHPFWSVDRRAFIPAERLRSGEQVRLADRSTAPVLFRSRDFRQASVYNLEVAGTHVYHVGDGGVLVHNACNLKVGYAKWESLAGRWLKGKGYKVIGTLKNGSNLGLDMVIKNMRTGEIMVAEVKAGSKGFHGLSKLQRAKGADGYARNVLGRLSQSNAPGAEHMSKVLSDAIGQPNSKIRGVVVQINESKGKIRIRNKPW